MRTRFRLPGESHRARFEVDVWFASTRSGVRRRVCGSGTACVLRRDRAGRHAEHARGRHTRRARRRQGEHHERRRPRTRWLELAVGRCWYRRHGRRRRKRDAERSGRAGTRACGSERADPCAHPAPRQRRIRRQRALAPRLGAEPVGRLRFSSDARQAGFTLNDAQRVDPVVARQYAAAAEALAAAAKADAEVRSLLRSEPRRAVREGVPSRALGAKVYRRPLTPAGNRRTGGERRPARPVSSRSRKAPPTPTASNRSCAAALVRGASCT